MQKRLLLIRDTLSRKLTNCTLLPYFFPSAIRDNLIAMVGSFCLPTRRRVGKKSFVSRIF